MLREGDPSPDFELARLESGEQARFHLGEETAAGRAVVVSFCPLDEAGSLERQLRHAAWFWDGAPVVPCVIDTSSQDAGSLSTTIESSCLSGETWPVLLDPFGTVAQWYGVPGQGQRALFVVGTDRRIAYAWYEGRVGCCPVREAIDALLSSTPAAWPEPAV